MRFFLLLLFIHQGVLSQNTSLLWEVTKEGMKDTSYLYGSIHFPQKALVNANKKLHEIKFKVDAGCFEIIISPDSMAYFSYSLMAGKGDKVNDLFSKKDAKRIFDYFSDNLEMEELMVDNFIPIGLSSFALMSFFTKDTTNAIDVLLQNDFKALGKPLLSLESIRQQVILFSQTPMEAQKKELLAVINNPDSVKKELDLLKEIYLRQDIDSLYSIVSNSASEGVFDKERMNSDRNLKMIKKMPYLMRDQSVLFCIGAAHLGGDKGLINLLRENGFQVTPIR
ncbi:MAG: TraB/GumN family protein [Flavobacteriales bacterium]|nr:TraB/GumN family protein [Flavobacteriales bacterium]